MASTVPRCVYIARIFMMMASLNNTSQHPTGLLDQYQPVPLVKLVESVKNDLPIIFDGKSFTKPDVPSIDDFGIDRKTHSEEQIKSSTQKNQKPSFLKVLNEELKFASSIQKPTVSTDVTVKGQHIDNLHQGHQLVPDGETQSEIGGNIAPPILKANGLFKSAFGRSQIEKSLFEPNQEDSKNRQQSDVHESSDRVHQEPSVDMSNPCPKGPAYWCQFAQTANKVVIQQANKAENQTVAENKIDKEVVKELGEKSGTGNEIIPEEHSIIGKTKEIGKQMPTVSEEINNKLGSKDISDKDEDPENDPVISSAGPNKNNSRAPLETNDEIMGSGNTSHTNDSIPGPGVPSDSNVPTLRSELPSDDSDPILGPGVPSHSSDPILGSGVSYDSNVPILRSELPSDDSDPILGSGLPSHSSNPILGSGVPSDSSDPILGTGVPDDRKDPILGPGVPSEDDDPILGSGPPVGTSDPILGGNDTDPAAIDDPVLGLDKCTWGPAYWCPSRAEGPNCEMTVELCENQYGWADEQKPETNTEDPYFGEEDVTTEEPIIGPSDHSTTASSYDGQHSNTSTETPPIADQGNMTSENISRSRLPETAEPTISTGSNGTEPDPVEPDPVPVAPTPHLGPPAIPPSLPGHEIIPPNPADPPPFPPSTGEPLLGGNKCTMGPAYWCASRSIGPRCSMTVEMCNDQYGWDDEPPLPEPEPTEQWGFDENGEEKTPATTNPEIPETSSPETTHEHELDHLDQLSSDNEQSTIEDHDEELSHLDALASHEPEENELDHLDALSGSWPQPPVGGPSGQQGPAVPPGSWPQPPFGGPSGQQGPAVPPGASPIGPAEPPFLHTPDGPILGLNNCTIGPGYWCASRSIGPRCGVDVELCNTQYGWFDEPPLSLGEPEEVWQYDDDGGEKAPETTNPKIPETSNKETTHEHELEHLDQLAGASKGSAPEAHEEELGHLDALASHEPQDNELDHLDQLAGASKGSAHEEHKELKHLDALIGTEPGH